MHIDTRRIAAHQPLVEPSIRFSKVPQSRQTLVATAQVTGPHSGCNLTFFSGKVEKYLMGNPMSFPTKFNCHGAEAFFLRGILTDDVVPPSPKFGGTSASATFCSSRMCSLRSIPWYPSHPQYVKGSQITRGRSSGGGEGAHEHDPSFSESRDKLSDCRQLGQHWLTRCNITAQELPNNLPGAPRGYSVANPR